MTSSYGVIGPMDFMMPVLQGGELVRSKKKPVKVGDIIGFAAPWGIVGVSVW
jgi:hypothetical protein